MKVFKHSIRMSLIFSILFLLATIGLELIEGYKITTTAYYGLKNIGVGFIIPIYILCIIIYFITFFPLTFFINKYIRNKLILRMIIYLLTSWLIGIWSFDKLYGHANGSFIKGYELNINNAIILYVMAGLVYSLFDYYLGRKINSK